MTGLIGRKLSSIPQRMYVRGGDSVFFDVIADVDINRFLLLSRKWSHLTSLRTITAFSMVLNRSLIRLLT